MAVAPLGGHSAIARFAEIDNAAPNEQVTLTLTPSQQATLLDRCFSLFKESTPPGVVETHLAVLCRPIGEVGQHGHTLRVEAFNALTRLAAPVNRTLFSLSIAKTMARVADGSLREQLGYRFLIDDLPVVADVFTPGQAKPMLRFLREVDRTKLPVMGVGKGAISGHDASKHPVFRQLADAHLLNRLADALPEDSRLSTPVALDTLALKIDTLNTHAQFEHQHHVALGEKVAVLGEVFPEHAFAIQFGTKFSFDGGRYAVVLQPEADFDALSSPVPKDVVLYEAEVSLWESDQYAPMIVAAIQRHVSSASVELQPLLRLAADPMLPTSRPESSANANASSTAPAHPAESDHKIDINVILKNALSAMRDDYLSNLPGALNPDALLALHRSVGAIAVGNTTIGALWELDQQGFDADAERVSLGLPLPSLMDPHRFA